MSHYFNRRSKKSLVTCTVALLCFVFFLSGWAWAKDAGLDINIYTRGEENDEGVTEPKLEFFLGDPVELWVVISNSSAWDVNTDPEIEAVELDRYIILKDPTGEKHTLNLEAAIDDMPPTITYGDWQVVPAKALKPGYVRSVHIVDVRELFPDMKTYAGPYEITVSMPITRYGWTVNVNKKLHGVLDDKAWHGNLELEPLAINIVPRTGGRLKVRVEDLSLTEGRYRNNVPVKVFRTSDVTELGLDGAWLNGQPLLYGDTNNGGWAMWPPGASCVVEPSIENGGSYTAVALYQGKLGTAVFEPGAEKGWGTACGGLLERYIFFNEQKDEFAVFGINSVRIRNNARVESGDVGAQAACQDDCLMSGYDVALEGGVRVADGSTIRANRIYLESTSSVYDVSYGAALDGAGTVRGAAESGLKLPVWKPLPDFQISESTEDDEVLTLDSSEVKTINDEFRYREVILGSHATLNLEPGTYHFGNVTLGAQSKLVCQAPVDIRIKGRLLSGGAKAAYVGSSLSTGSARDVVVYVEGDLEAVAMGQGNSIRANVYAPNGSFSTGEGCVLEGSVIARDISLGQKTVVRYDGAFSSGGQEEPQYPFFDFEGVSEKIRNKYYVNLTWDGGPVEGQVNIYRGTEHIVTMPNITKKYTDNLGTKPASEYTYRICDAADAGNCADITVFINLL